MLRNLDHNIMETVKINGKNYQISFIDTEDTIKNMIALREQTFTDYIRYSVYKPKDNDIQVTMIHDELNSVSEDDLVNTIDELHKNWGISKRDLALEWLEINHGGAIQDYDLDLFDIFKEINSTDFWSIGAITTEYQSYQKKKAAKLQDLGVLVEKETEFRDEYSKYTPLDTTKFLQDSVIIEYQITISLDPLEAFDNIKLNSTIPFARLKTADQVYYKLLKTLVPQKDWLEGDSTLMFKIYRSGDKDGWGTATINYTGSTEPYTAVMTIESTVGAGKSGKKKTSENEIKAAILGLFNGADITINDRQEKGVKGVFAIPEMSISRDVFLDLVTNEPMVSHYLYVDETRELSSQKGVLYLYYSPGETESQVLTVFLSDRTASRSDIFYTSKELLLFTPYLNVRVSRAMNLDQIERFQQAFAVILDIYKKKFTGIVKAYNTLIPGFKAANELSIKKTVRADKRLKELQTQDSELFIHGYPTSCERKRQPIPVPKNKQKKWEKDDHQIMNYPKGSNNFFVCAKENEYQFPGLMKNKLNNADVYPYLPCCYPKNQQSGNKLWNVYLQDLTKTSQSKTTNIVTKKAVTSGKLGQLPRNIYYILHKSAKKGEDYLRQGVSISNNSFIETVLLALDPDYEKIDNAKKPEYIQDFRNNLASEDFSSIIQQLYDGDAEKITQDILDPNIPFDSKLFIGLLEAYYNCQIVVFERSEQQPNGEFEIPRYTQGYLYKKLDPKIKTVLVYKHFGIRSDSLENPHYELIIKKFKKLTTWHFENDIMIRDVYSYFLQTYKLYLIGIGRYTAINIPPDSIADAKGQVIDRYGKCRGYTFKNNIFITTSPITPADDVPIVETPTERPTKKAVLAFTKEHGLTISQQDISGDAAIGVTVNFQGIPYVYIPFEPASKLSGVPEAQHLGFSVPTQDDILQKTLYNRKIADFLMQLVLYDFSLWYADQSETSKYKDKQQEIDQLPIANQQVREKSMLLEMVEEYLQNQLVVIPDHDYDVRNLPRRLTVNNSFFQDEQLVVNSQETLDKLSYYLRFMITKNKTLVLYYSERTYLDNYYTYTNDFKQRKGQLVFVGGLSVSNWIETQEQGVSNQVHTIPHAYLNEPFFFSHWALNGGKPVIFQNVKYGNIGRALSVAANYAKDGINIGHDATPVKEISHTVYFIEDGILKRDGNSPITIWRFDDGFYAALLVP